MTAAGSFTLQLPQALRKVRLIRHRQKQMELCPTPSFLISQELGEEGSQEGNRAVAVHCHVQRGATRSDEAIQL